MMLQGMSRIRPPHVRSQAHPCIQPLSAMHRMQRIQPLPQPLAGAPYHYSLAAAIPGIEQKAAKLGKLVFHTCGDTGGVKRPEAQIGVVTAMKKDLLLPAQKAPTFFYHLG